ncbi:hypothetical protein U1Q18_037759 [Sarracenia purpurea var. burkii]
MESPNRLSALQSLNAEDDLKLQNASTPQPKGPKSAMSIMEEALCVHGNLKVMLRDNSMDDNLTKLFCLEKKSLESDFNDITHLLPEKLDAIEAYKKCVGEETCRPCLSSIGEKQNDDQGPYQVTTIMPTVGEEDQALDGRPESSLVTDCANERKDNAHSHRSGNGGVRSWADVVDGRIINNISNVVDQPRS